MSALHVKLQGCDSVSVVGKICLRCPAPCRAGMEDREVTPVDTAFEDRVRALKSQTLEKQVTRFAGSLPEHRALQYVP